MNKDYAFLYAPITIVVYLLTNLMLNIFNIQLCETNGCQLTKELIKFDSNYLYAAGVLGFLTLYTIGSYSKHLNYKSPPINYLYSAILYIMIISETILITYFVFKTNDICILCSIFYLLMIIQFIMIKISLNDKNFNNMFKVGTIIVITIILSLFVLKINSNEKIVFNSQYTLIESKSCIHCKNTKEFLNEKHIMYSKTNYKGLEEFLSPLNISTIPVLIIKEESTFTIINGEQKIKEYFNNKLNKSISIPSFINSNNNISIFEQPKDDGCKIQSLEVGCD